MRGFEEWWDHWIITGTRRGKIAAANRFIAARKSASLDDLVTGLDRYMDYCKSEGTEIRHIIHPERFLSKGYWENEYPEQPKLEDPAGVGRQFEPDPADYGLHIDSQCVGRSGMSFRWLLPGGERREIAR